MKEKTLKQTILKWALPGTAMIALVGLFALLLTPMLTSNNNIKDVPVIIVNNAGAYGDMFVGAVDQSGMLEITHMTDSAQAINAINDTNDYYAVLIIPANFLAGDDLILYLNQGKNATGAQTVESVFTNVAAAFGAPTRTLITFEKTIVNPVVGSSLASNFIVLMTFLPSLILAMLVNSMLKPSGEKGKTRAKGVGIQMVYALFMSIILGVLMPTIVCAIAGATVSFSLMMFMALSAFAFQTLLIGCVSWLGKAGVSVSGVLLVFGMGAANLPYHFLPTFWQNVICPWIPHYYMANGVRSIMYMDGNFIAAPVIAISITAVVGMTVLATTIFKPNLKQLTVKNK